MVGMPADKSRIQIRDTYSLSTFAESSREGHDMNFLDELQCGFAYFAMFFCFRLVSLQRTYTVPFAIFDSAFAGGPVQLNELELCDIPWSHKPPNLAR